MVQEVSEAGKSKGMFNDRRSGIDRRSQHLPMPAGLDRRQKESIRRSGQFSSQPWWLRIDYAVELVSEKLLTEHREIRQNPPRSKSASRKNNEPSDKTPSDST